MKEEQVRNPRPSTSALSKEEEEFGCMASTEGVVRDPADLKNVSISHASTSTQEYKDFSPDFGYGLSVPFAPWRRKRYNLSVDGLHEEIIDLYHWVKPNTLETKIRRKVYDKVCHAIMRRWRERKITISMFGSLRTNLFLPSSDIDILVECSEFGDLNNDERLKKWLVETAEALKEDDIAESVTVFGGAFVPIVKMVDKDTRLSIDISFNTVQGVRAADYIEKVKREFPIIEPLVLLLKQFLHYRNLNQTFTGGLSSYGLILLLVNFLQMYAMSMRRKQIYDKGVNFGELLLRFFEVYSQEFNFEDLGICVSQVRYVPKTVAGAGNYTAKRTNSGNLSIEDPLLSSNDVGRSTYNFGAISNAFAQALQIITVALTVRDRRRSHAWQKAYKGSMLHLIMPFTLKEICYRNWLKGGTISYPPMPTYPEHNFVTNTLLSPVLNLKHYEWLRKAPLGFEKVSRPLKIVSPEEVEKAKKAAEEQQQQQSQQLQEQQQQQQQQQTQEQIQQSEPEVSVETPTISPEEVATSSVALVEQNEEAENDSSENGDDSEVGAPPMPTSTASVTTSATMSTIASGSERGDTDSPPLSSVVPSSDDEIHTENKSTQVQVSNMFKKPFSEVVAANKPKTSNGYRHNYYNNNNGYSNSCAQNNNNHQNNRYRGQANRARRSSRNHSQGSNDGSDGYASYRYDNENYLMAPRGRTSSNSSSRSYNGYDSRNSRNRSNNYAGPSSSSSYMNQRSEADEFNGNGRRNGRFRYADAVKCVNATNRDRAENSDNVQNESATENGFSR